MNELKLDIIFVYEQYQIYILNYIDIYDNDQIFAY